MRVLCLFLSVYIYCIVVAKGWNNVYLVLLFVSTIIIICLFRNIPTSCLTFFHYTQCVKRLFNRQHWLCTATSCHQSFLELPTILIYRNTFDLVIKSDIVFVIVSIKNVLHFRHLAKLECYYWLCDILICDFLEKTFWNTRNLTVQS